MISWKFFSNPPGSPSSAFTRITLGFTEVWATSVTKVTRRKGDQHSILSSQYFPEILSKMNYCLVHQKELTITKVSRNWAYEAFLLHFCFNGQFLVVSCFQSYQTALMNIRVQSFLTGWQVFPTFPLHPTLISLFFREDSSSHMHHFCWWGFLGTLVLCG